MNLDPVISALRSRASVFEDRVYGAALWAGLEENEASDNPCAYVVPLAEEPGSQISNNGYYQPVVNRFGVIVIVDQAVDVRGHDAARRIDSIKSVLFHALLGWQQEPRTDYGEVIYEGGAVLHIDTARLIWQFEFSFETYIGTEDTYQGDELAALSALEGADIKVDCIDPSTKDNQPDGQIESQLKVDL